MGAVYKREGSRFWWLKWFDARGQEQRRSSETADEAEARTILAEIERQERAKAPPAAPGGVTVEEWVDEVWLPQRQREQPSAWKTDRSRLRHHFLPYFGDRALADMGTDRGEQDMLDWLIGLRRHPAKRDGQPIGPRTAWNVWSIVKVLFADAKERRAIARSPCDGLRPRKHLPPKTDKVRGIRDSAGFTLDQVVQLTTDPAIPFDRRVYYGLGFLGGGLRPSSRAIARWRDLDRTKRPLWRLSIAGAYDTANRLEKQRTKTGAIYHVPVHPVLQRMLESWWSSGWEEFIGRQPTPDDFMVPRQDGTPRRVDDSLEQFYADLDRVGFPRQRQYEARATFRTLALDGGADSAQVDTITHPRLVSGPDFYRRLERGWEARCAAVLCIGGGAWGPAASTSAGGVTVEVTAYGFGQEKAPPNLTLGGARLVTPTGFEPMFST